MPSVQPTHHADDVRQLGWQRAARRTPRAELVRPVRSAAKDPRKNNLYDSAVEKLKIRKPKAEIQMNFEIKMFATRFLARLLDFLES